MAAPSITHSWMLIHFLWLQKGQSNTLSSLGCFFLGGAGVELFRLPMAPTPSRANLPPDLTLPSRARLFQGPSWGAWAGSEGAVKAQPHAIDSGHSRQLFGFLHVTELLQVLMNAKDQCLVRDNDYLYRLHLIVSGQSTQSQLCSTLAPGRSSPAEPFEPIFLLPNLSFPP